MISPNVIPTPKPTFSAKLLDLACNISRIAEESTGSAEDREGMLLVDVGWR